MMKSHRKLKSSFNCAIEGVLWAVRTQRHMRYHCLAAVAVVLAGLLFRVSALEFLFLVFGAVLVLFAELVNTAVEVLVDLVSPDYHPLAMRAKDVAAGAVLLASIGAAVMGYLILAGHIFPSIARAEGQVLAAQPPGVLAVFSGLTVIILVVLLKAWAGHGTPLEGGMPSGHAAFAFSVAVSVAVSQVGPVVALLALALAVLVGHSRIRLGVHSLTEVLAGAAVGGSVTWLLYLCFG
jgi:diacylglycerol kinase (ATP)